MQKKKTMMGSHGDPDTKTFKPQRSCKKSVTYIKRLFVKIRSISLRPF